MILTDAAFSRRSILQGIGAIIGAPAIVRIDSLMAMPRRPLILPGDFDFYPCDGSILSEDGHPVLFNALRALDRKRLDYAEHLSQVNPGLAEQHRLLVGRQYGGSAEDKTFALPNFYYEAEDATNKSGSPVSFELDRYGTLYEVAGGERLKIG